MNAEEISMTYMLLAMLICCVSIPILISLAIVADYFASRNRTQRFIDSMKDYDKKW